MIGTQSCHPWQTVQLGAENIYPLRLLACFNIYLFTYLLIYLLIYSYSLLLTFLDLELRQLLRHEFDPRRCEHCR